MSGVNPEEFRALGVEVAVMRTKNEARDDRLDDHDRRFDEAKEERREMQKDMGDVVDTLRKTNETTGEIRDHLKKASSFRAKWEAWLTPTRVLTFLVLLVAVGTAVRQLMAGEEVDLTQIQALEEVVVPVTVP